MKTLIFSFAVLALVLYGCGGSTDEGTEGSAEAPKSMIEDTKPDDGKGIGEVTHVDLNDPLVASMVAKGQGIFDMKCSACHKTTEMRVVGPGFKGLTERRKPEWIMNMITNADVMLDQDPTAQALLKECLVRMPNQNLSIDDARAVLEYAYANDGKPVGK